MTHLIDVAAQTSGSRSHPLFPSHLDLITVQQRVDLPVGGGRDRERERERGGGGGGGGWLCMARQLRQTNSVLNFVLKLVFRVAWILFLAVGQDSVFESVALSWEEHSLNILLQTLKFSALMTRKSISVRHSELWKTSTPLRLLAKACALSKRFSRQDCGNISYVHDFESSLRNIPCRNVQKVKQVASTHCLSRTFLVG